MRPADLLLEESLNRRWWAPVTTIEQQSLGGRMNPQDQKQALRDELDRLLGRERRKVA